MGPTSFGAAGVATLRRRRREQVYGNEPRPPRPLFCRARPPAREARERGAGPGAAATAAAAAGTRGDRVRAGVRVCSSSGAGGRSRGAGEGTLGCGGPAGPWARGASGRRWREPGAQVEARRQPAVVGATQAQARWRTVGARAHRRAQLRRRRGIKAQAPRGARVAPGDLRPGPGMRRCRAGRSRRRSRRRR